MENEVFIDQLTYLGGNLGLSKKIKNYIDLEAFFLESTMHLRIDTRVSQTILNWAYYYVPLLSPSKIRRLIKKGLNYDPFGLHIIYENVKSILPTNWSILLCFCKKSGKNEKIPNKFVPNPFKYLKDQSYILKICPEIKWRTLGLSQVGADIRAYLEKNELETLYKLAKEIFSPRNRVNEEYRSFNSYKAFLLSP